MELERGKFLGLPPPVARWKYSPHGAPSQLTKKVTTTTKLKAAKIYANCFLEKYSRGRMTSIFTVITMAMAINTMMLRTKNREEISIFSDNKKGMNTHKAPQKNI